MFYSVATSFFESTGLPLALLCAAAGLAFAFYLIKSIIAVKIGNEKMREIASAIEEGAKAYLHRQLISIGIIAAVLVVLIACFKDFPTAVGFVLGAVCSLTAGFVG